MANWLYRTHSDQPSNVARTSTFFLVIRLHSTPLVYLPLEVILLEIQAVF